MKNTELMLFLNIESLGVFALIAEQVATIEAIIDSKGKAFNFERCDYP